MEVDLDDLELIIIMDMINNNYFDLILLNEILIRFF